MLRRRAPEQRFARRKRNVWVVSVIFDNQPRVAFKLLFGNEADCYLAALEAQKQAVRAVRMQGGGTIRVYWRGK